MVMQDFNAWGSNISNNCSEFFYVGMAGSCDITKIRRGWVMRYK